MTTGTLSEHRQRTPKRAAGRGCGRPVCRAREPAQCPAGRLRRHRGLVRFRSAVGAHLQRLHRRHRLRSRRVLARQFHRGLFELAHPAIVLEFIGVRRRYGADDAGHGRARRLGGRAHGRARRQPLSHAVAVVVRSAGIADGDGLDFRLQPEHRLGQCGAQIGVRAHRGAREHLFDGGNDLGAVEPLFSARVSGAWAGLAGARRAHGRGRPDGRRKLPAGLRQGHVAVVAARDPFGAAAPVRDGHGVLRGTAPYRPAGAHRRVHHRHPGRHHRGAAGLRGRKRARPHLTRDLRARRILLSPRHAARGIVRHHHRQGL